MSNNVLGRGLSSLLKDDILPISDEKQISTIHISEIEISDLQPRKIFDDSKIKELAHSIESNGLIQPIILNKCSSGKYKIIAGERRYRACQIANLEQIPVIIKNLDNRQQLAIALVENIQREELTPIEEAECYRRLMNEFSYTSHDLASAIGKSRSHIANIVRLTTLSQKIKDMVNSGALSMSQARCLVGIENAEELADKIMNHDLSVRQVEKLIRNKNIKSNRSRTALSTSYVTKESDDDLAILSHSLSKKLGVKVVVENSDNGGKISIYYSTPDELDSILTQIRD